MVRSEAGRPAQREIDVTALRGLAHPLRLRLWDALTTYGPATATLLARRFGESTASTSYHLRQLAKHGFVEEDPSRGVGRERYWRPHPGGAVLNAHDLEDSPATREAAHLVLGEYQRNHAARLAHWLTAGYRSEPRQWANASRSSATHLALRVEELGALNDELSEVLDRWSNRVRDREDADARQVEIQVSGFPLPPQEE